MSQISDTPLPEAEERACQEAIARIAQQLLDIPTLETRRHETIDFYERSIWNLKAALEAAYVAGRDSMKNISINSVTP